MGEHAVDELAGHLGGVLGKVVERGHDGEDSRARIRRKLHIAQMDTVEGRLADAKDEAALLLEADVGGTLDEVRGQAVGDAGERPHGAG